MHVAVTSRREIARVTRRILELLREGPVEVHVAPEAAPEFIMFLESRFILYSADAGEDGVIVYRLVLPEHYLRVDPRIEMLSEKLTDPSLLRSAVKVGGIVEAGVVESPRQLVGLLRELSLAGRSLLLLVSERVPARAAVFFSRGRLVAAWVETVDVVSGLVALRQLMYYGPYKYVVIGFPG